MLIKLKHAKNSAKNISCKKSLDLQTQLLSCEEPYQQLQWVNSVVFQGLQPWGTAYSSTEMLDPDREIMSSDPVWNK